MSEILHAALPEFLAGVATALVVAAATKVARAVRGKLKRDKARIDTTRNLA